MVSRGHTGRCPAANGSSCLPCNKKFGKLENDVLGRLGLCLDPAKAESAGIPAKALRAVGIGVESELSSKEKAIRKKLYAKLRREMIPYSQVARRPGILPGFGPHNGFALESQMAISINADALKGVCGKIVRGLEHYGADRYVEPPYVLEIFFNDNKPAESLAGLFGPPSLHLGPGFRIQRAVTNDGSGHALYRIKIWDSLLMHGSIIIPAPTNP